MFDLYHYANQVLLCHYARTHKTGVLFEYLYSGTVDLRYTDHQICIVSPFYCTTAHIMLFEQAANLLSKYNIIDMVEEAY